MLKQLKAPRYPSPASLQSCSPNRPYQGRVIDLTRDSGELYWIESLQQMHPKITTPLQHPEFPEPHLAQPPHGKSPVFLYEPPSLLLDHLILRNDHPFTFGFPVTGNACLAPSLLRDEPSLCLRSQPEVPACISLAH